jgi:hypothetical protein
LFAKENIVNAPLSLAYALLSSSTHPSPPTPSPSSLSFFSSSGSRSSSHFHHRHHLSFLESLRLSSFSHFTIGCSPASSFEERGSPRRGTPVSFCPLPSFSSYSSFSSFSSSSSSSSFSSSSSSSSSYPSLARWKAPRPLAPSRVPSAPTLVCTTTAALERERERESKREQEREQERGSAYARLCVCVLNGDYRVLGRAWSPFRGGRTRGSATREGKEEEFPFDAPSWAEQP